MPTIKPDATEDQIKKINKFLELINRYGIKQKEVYESLGLSQPNFNAGLRGHNDAALEAGLQYLIDRGIDEAGDVFINEKNWKKEFEESLKVSSARVEGMESKIALYAKLLEKNIEAVSIVRSDQRQIKKSIENLAEMISKMLVSTGTLTNQQQQLIRLHENNQITKEELIEEIIKKLGEK